VAESKRLPTSLVVLHQLISFTKGLIRSKNLGSVGSLDL
jgi:hypothetical protein